MEVAELLISPPPLLRVALISRTPTKSAAAVSPVGGPDGAPTLDAGDVELPDLSSQPLADRGGSLATLHSGAGLVDEDYVPEEIEAGSGGTDEEDRGKKRRRTTGMHFKTSRRRGGGSGKVGRLERVWPSNGARAVPKVATTNTGLARLAPTAGAQRRRAEPMSSTGICNSQCSVFLEGLKPQLLHARRSKIEEAAKNKKSPGTGQGVHNFTRLKAAISRLCFDAAGNWLVHEKFCRSFLGVSNRWMSHAHHLAISLRQRPTDTITAEKLSLLTGEARNRAVADVITPRDCPMTVEQYLRRGAPEDKIFVQRSITSVHGLGGKISNAARSDAREAFREFLCLNRSPAGRTADKNRRVHGAGYYLDAKWTVFTPSINVYFPDDRYSFFQSFCDALASRKIKVVHSRTVERWFEIDFGSVKLENGFPVPSPEHTAVFPHATDACNVCCE